MYKISIQILFKLFLNLPYDKLQINFYRKIFKHGEYLQYKKA